MSAVEIEIEAKEGCDGNCACGGEMKPMEPVKTKDQLIAELKALLAETSSTGVAERWVKIDELIAKINDIKEKD